MENLLQELDEATAKFSEATKARFGKKGEW
jgi:hypothetical protein